MSLIAALRSAISGPHYAIEQTPYSKALMSDYLHPRDYARGLAQLGFIHHLIEGAIDGLPQVARFFTPAMIRTATVTRDLEALGYPRARFAMMPETEVILNQMRRWSSERPLALLGCIYILEGSRMGSMIIAGPLRKALGLSDGQIAGLEYHLEGAPETPARMRALREKIDGAGFDERESADVTEGAVTFMELLNNLYAALPVSPRLPIMHITAGSVSGNFQQV